MKRGSVAMEAVVALPLALLLVFGIVETALLMTAKTIVKRAAYCAARAAAVAPPSERAAAARKAAEIALSWVSLADGGDGGVEVPGWGRVLGSGSAAQRIGVAVSGGSAQGLGITAEVSFAFPLMIPAMGIDEIMATGEGTIFGWRYAVIRERCTMPADGFLGDYPAGAFAEDGGGW